MTDYTKLVEALRCYEISLYCNECEYGKWDDEVNCWYCDGERRDKDAAAAIEALQAENPIVETVLVDKMRQQMEETVCHCNVKENAELIAKILDDDVDRKVFELPKRGEWSEENRRPRSSQFVCSVCHRTAYDPQPTRDKAWRKRCRYAYCPNCGAKMEVQE